jgi:cytochrome P450
VIVGISHGREIDSVITIADEHRHNVLRRSVASAFSAHTALDYEPHIDRTINELLMALSKESEDGILRPGRRLWIRVQQP